MNVTGDSGLTEYRWRTSTPITGKVVSAATEEQTLSDDLITRFRIYFPTQETVARSKGGPGVSGPEEFPY